MAKGKIFKTEIVHIQGIEVTVHRKTVKNLNMRIYPSTGKVNISVPRRFTMKEVERFVHSRHQWIQNHLSSFKKHQRSTIIPADTAKISVWGQEYELKVIEKEKKPNILLTEDGFMIMQVRPDTSFAKRMVLLKEWYRGELKREIPPLIQKWEPRMKVKVREFGVKQMKTRWGTCNIRDHRIWLSLELAKKSPQCLEYVVVHEMVHLLERLHSKRFYALMDHFLPNWREVRELRDMRCER